MWLSNVSESSPEYFSHKTKKGNLYVVEIILTRVLACKLVYRETSALLLNCGLRISLDAIKINNTFVYMKAGMHYSAAFILGLACSYLRSFVRILK